MRIGAVLSQMTVGVRATGNHRDGNSATGYSRTVPVQEEQQAVVDEGGIPVCGESDSVASPPLFSERGGSRSSTAGASGAPPSSVMAALPPWRPPFWRPCCSRKYLDGFFPEPCLKAN